MPAAAAEVRLIRGLEALGLDLDDGQRSQLLAYLNLLEQWNRRFNLTAVRDPQEMIVRHLLDSLVVLPFIGGEWVIDVGTGAGLPGVPLAIAEPDRAYTLLDSNGKKTRFLMQVKTVLDLPGVTVAQERVENYAPGHRFDRVVTRAFASLDAMITGCRALLAPGGEMLAMKGQYPVDELNALPSGFRVLAIEPLTVPGLDEERCVVRIASDRN